MMMRILALVSLAACLAFPLMYFWGQIGMPAYQNLLAAGTLAWFVFATAAVTRRGPER